MPKENTHLFFAQMLLERLSGRDPYSLLEDHKKEFFLGSILPDAFFYHPKREVNAVSKRLHGIGDNPREITAAFLMGARDRLAVQDLAYTLGYLSHCALDKVFHPIIVNLSGNYRDPDPVKRSAAQYRHRLLETDLDRRINTRCFVGQMIDLRPLSGINSLGILSERTKVSLTRLKFSYRLQRRANRLFKTKWAYYLARLIEKSGKSELKVILPLFYAHTDPDGRLYPEEVMIPSIEGSGDRQGSIEEMLDAAAVVAEKIFDAACIFYQQGGDSNLSRLKSLVPEKF